MSNRGEQHSFDKKNYQSLQPYQNELFQLTELAGIHINPLFIWVFIQLLNNRISPEIIYKLLKLIKRSAKATKPRRMLSRMKIN